MEHPNTSTDTTFKPSRSDRTKEEVTLLRMRILTKSIGYNVWDVRKWVTHKFCSRVIKQSIYMRFGQLWSTGLPANSITLYLSQHGVEVEIDKPIPIRLSKLWTQTTTNKGPGMP